MKKIVLSIFVAIMTLSSFAQENPLWLRGASISPNGEQVAFNFKGDIYTVPVKGGRATAITTNPAYDGFALWSPDSKTLAFASDREGGFDIFKVSAEGGAPERLTFHSKSEKPLAFLNDTTIMFGASIQPDIKANVFPSRRFSQVYTVSINGGRSQLFSSISMDAISVLGDKILYQDIKGVENKLRKHHTSSVTRDIWLLEDGKFTKQSTFKGEDLSPVWSEDGKSFYYVSGESGTMNVFKKEMAGKTQQLTNFTKNPVRGLSKSANGTFVFSYAGEIYSLKEGAKPQKIEIKIIRDDIEKKEQTKYISSKAQEFAVSPKGKEIAFIVRGDIFVTSSDYSITKRITNTSEEERDINFSPDGRSLVYASERNGIWGIYKSSISRKDEKNFTYSTDIEEELLIKNSLSSFQPQYSPDGKSIAYFEDRTALRVYDVSSKKIKTVLEGKYNYSYSDNDISFEWSPDGKYLLTSYIGIGGWNSPDVAVINVKTKEVTNLTQSGYSDNGAKWVLGGKAIIWSSDKAGMRSHGSWGSTNDVYITFFDAEAYDKFKMSKEELELLNPDKGDKKDEKASKKEKKSKKKNDIKYDFNNHKERTIRLTINSSRLVDYILSKDGSKLYYLASFEGQPDLWVRDFKDSSTKILIKGAGYGSFQKDSKEDLFILANGGLGKVDVTAGKVKSISFSAEFKYKPSQEREYIFEHVWRLITDKFYDKNLHGVDWNGYKAEYSRFLPYINNNHDFAEMLSEFLGELNASHTGAYSFSSKVIPTAFLCASYDNNYKGDGLKIAEIIEGSPLHKAGSKIKAGDIITKINGVELSANKDYYHLLEGKIGKVIELSVKSGRKEYLCKIKPVSYGFQTKMLYKRWVKRCKAIVDSLSKGKLGYVHVEGMDSHSFREVYSDVIGLYRNREALIVDTRNNGGGWLHDDLVTLLSGKVYETFEPRGRYIGSDPFTKWTKPSIVLQCESNYSNAHGFPYIYKTLGIGKLVGTPVAGTMTAVWWENQIDNSIVVGIPEIGVKTTDGEYLENKQLEPDILIYNSPEDILSGKDRQLEGAISELLK
ncbi:MAG: PD40 domain-containing protein [Bacteroidetes bacterium]|nr:PD40 domain-containing protein [Bacteroidota bacterium]